MVNCFRILHKKSVKLAKRNCRSCPTILKIQRCHKLKPLLFRLKRSVVTFVLGEFLLANLVMLKKTINQSKCMLSVHFSFYVGSAELMS